MCGYLGIWIYGYVDIWLYGYMDLWIYIATSTRTGCRGQVAQLLLAAIPQMLQTKHGLATRATNSSYNACKLEALDPTETPQLWGWRGSTKKILAGRGDFIPSNPESHRGVDNGLFLFPWHGNWVTAWLQLCSKALMPNKCVQCSYMCLQYIKAGGKGPVFTTLIHKAGQAGLALYLTCYFYLLVILMFQPGSRTPSSQL